MKNIEVQLKIPVRVRYNRVLQLQNFLEQTLSWPKRVLWPIWAKTLGNKISTDNTVADTAALIRTIWILIQLATCVSIIANCIRHWNG